MNSKEKRLYDYINFYVKAAKHKSQNFNTKSVCMFCFYNEEYTVDPNTPVSQIEQYIKEAENKTGCCEIFDDWQPNNIPCKECQEIFMEEEDNAEDKN